jgi:hypothetical protein
MHLVLSEARKTNLFHRGDAPFRYPDFHAPVDEYDVIRLEGVIRFYSATGGMYVTFDSNEHAWAAHEKTQWLGDNTQPNFTLFANYNWGANCFVIGETSYMNWRVEEI